MKFLEAEKAIKDKKLIHNEVMKQGVEFLTEIELRKAPPLEYFLKNIESNRENFKSNDDLNDANITTTRASDTVKNV